MKKLILTMAAGLMLASSAHAGPYWKQLLKDFNISNPEKQSMCFTSEDGGIIGENAYMKVRLASVSKLMTTLWAVSTLGSDYQYPSKFYFNGKKLHIEGSLDPVFSKRKLFFLLNQFNNLGIHELEEITFNDQLRVFTKSERYLGEILNVTPARTAANLKDFMQTSEWNLLKKAYKDFIATTPDKILDELQITKNFEELNLKVGKVSLSNKNKLKDLEGTEGYVHLSPAIEVYLKYMNVVSNNYFADQTFDKLGGEKKFDEFIAPLLKDLIPELEEKRTGYKDGELSIKLFSGSGLNTTRNGARVDNYASCAIIVRMIEHLNQKMVDADKELQKIAAVVGVDLGTFRRRLRSPRLARTIIAKTGTLYHTSAIAGTINTSTKKRYFGIFNQLTGWKGGAKMVQNKMIEKLWEIFGAAKFDYKPEFFFPAVEPLAPLQNE